MDILTELFTTALVPAAFAGVAWGILGGALPGIRLDRIRLDGTRPACGVPAHRAGDP